MSSADGILFAVAVLAPKPLLHVVSRFLPSKYGIWPARLVALLISMVVLGVVALALGEFRDFLRGLGVIPFLAVFAVVFAPWWEPQRRTGI